MIPFFLPTDQGHRFCIFHKACAEMVKGAVLYVHPFAEEMNKTRRMAAIQSRALAAAGYDVLQIDLCGCGDSAGDFSDATWDAWQNDVLAGCQYLRSVSAAPLILWGMRAGCLLVAQASSRFELSADFIFWQPVISGRLHWQQFLRLKTAAAMVSGGARGEGNDWRQQLALEGILEIAGYGLAAALVQGMESAQLIPPLIGVGRVIWLEASPRAEAIFSPNSVKGMDPWRLAGYELTSRMVNAPAFWQSVEIEEAPELVDATLECLGAWR